MLNSSDDEEVCSWLYDALNFTLRTFSPAPMLNPFSPLLPVDSSLPVRKL